MWEVDHKEGWEPMNQCFQTVVLERTLESPVNYKEIQPVNPKGNQSNIHWKDWCWSWSSNTVATWCKESTHWKRSCWWKRLTAGGEGDDREWDGWMASPIQQTWAWANSRRWWRTGKPVLHAAVHDVAKSQTQLSDWTTTMPMYGIQKGFTDEPVCRAGIDTDVENRHVDMREKGGWEKYWDSRTDIWIFLCVKQITSGNLLHSTGSSARSSVVTEMDGMGWWEVGSREWRYVYVYLLYLIVKQLYYNFEKKKRTLISIFSSFQP